MDKIENDGEDGHVLRVVGEGPSENPVSGYRNEVRAGQTKLWNLGERVKTLALRYIKTCYKALEMERVKCGHKDREIEGRIEKPETRPQLSGD